MKKEKLKAELTQKIKDAEALYYKESPCRHCGPGNGCDDCRGCEDSLKDWQLHERIKRARKEYEDEIGIPYDQDVLFNQITQKQEEYNTFKDSCRKCGGNFDDDCQDCDKFEIKLKVLNSLKYLKNEFKSKYNIDYENFKEQQEKYDVTEERNKLYKQIEEYRSQINDLEEEISNIKGYIMTLEEELEEL